MKGKLAITGALILVMVASVALVACAPKPAAQPPVTAPAPGKPTGEVTLGRFTNITGPGAPNYIGYDMGVDIYTSYINEVKGGIEGEKGIAKVKVLTADTQYSVPKGKEQWASFKEEGMDIAWCVMSGLVEGMWVDAENDKIPFLTGSIGSRSLYSDWMYVGGNNGVRPAVASMIDAFIIMREQAGKSGMPGVGFLLLDSPPAPLFVAGIPQYMKELGFEKELVSEIYPAESTDVTVHLKRLYEKGVTDIVFWGSAPDVVMTLKSFDRAGLRDKMQLWVSYAIGPADVIKLGGPQLAEGMGVVYWWVPPLKTPEMPDPPGLKLARELWQEAKPGEAISDLYMYSIPQMMILEAAIGLALDEFAPDELTGARIKEYGLDRMRNVDMGGLIVPVTYEAGVIPHDYGCSNSYWTIHDGVAFPAIGNDISWVRCPMIVPPPEE